MCRHNEPGIDRCLPCLPAGAPAPPLAAALAADYARLFRALSDETRVQIVRLLAAQAEPLCACHIESAFGLTQSGISYHLKVLREASLVCTERRGTWIYYQLRPDRLRDLSRFAEQQPSLA